MTHDAIAPAAGPRSAAQHSGAHSGSASGPRDDEAVGRFIERFAGALVDAGVPRMPARVFVALLATDSGRMTALELSERLRISPAAVSGAVRHLAQVNLVSRERDPGSRRDHYVVHDDLWYEATVQQTQRLARWDSRLREGVGALGRHTPAGARLAETVAFFEFVEGEMDQMLQRWKERRAALRAADATG